MAKMIITMTNKLVAMTKTKPVYRWQEYSPESEVHDCDEVDPLVRRSTAWIGVG